MNSATRATGCLLVLIALSSACDSESAPPTPTSTSSATSPQADAGPDSREPRQPRRTRVDTDTPTFSDPTALTNPLFAINEVTQLIQLGVEGRDQLRFEVTLLPETRTVRWQGQRVQTRVHQFVAYSNGRILEVAEDFYAQADDGSVWYFGESVDNYEAGVIADHEGAWLAGRDGPPGMIMPAEPRVGDVYRPENIPGLVFEEVTVTSTDETVQGPRGPVHGAVLIQERLQDGTLEDKTFAPGYGEFEARVPTEDEHYGAAVAVPTDALRGPLPQELSTLAVGAERLVARAGAGHGRSLTRTLGTMTDAWDAHRRTEVPPKLEARLTAALDALEAAVRRGADAPLTQAALDTRQATLDLQLQYVDPALIDVSRMDVWGDQLHLDAAAGTAHAVRGDVAVLETIWRRVEPTADAATVARIPALLEELRGAATTADLHSAARLVARIQRLLSD